MAEVKGHTELPWSLNPHHPRLINGGPNHREVAKTAFGTDDELDENTANANLIVTAVNTYPAVEGLVKALELSLGALHEAEAILGGEYGDHYGPLCEKMFELEEASKTALSRFRSLQNGGQHD